MSEPKTPINSSSIPSDHHEDSLDSIREDIDKQPVKERELLEGILELMKDDKGRKLFLRMISVAKMENVRPMNWSKAANAPYYRKHFAMELRPTIDLMIEDHRDRVYLYADERISKKSLQLKLFQAFDFLVKEMDTEDFRYRTARENIVITKERQCIRLTWAPGSKLGNATLVNYGGDIFVKLLDDIDEFLETAPEGSKFERTDVQLADEEVERIQNSLIGLVNVTAIVQPKRVKILKLTAEQMEMLKES